MRVKLASTANPLLQILLSLSALFDVVFLAQIALVAFKHVRIEAQILGWFLSVMWLTEPAAVFLGFKGNLSDTVSYLSGCVLFSCVALVVHCFFLIDALPVGIVLNGIAIALVVPRLVLCTIASRRTLSLSAFLFRVVKPIDKE